MSLVCSSSEEACQVISAVQKGINSNLLDVKDVNETLLEHCLYTGHSPQVDLLIRTSGETRLSDFLLWQSRRALLVFSKVLWPDYSFADFVSAIMKYQSKAHLLDEIGEIQHQIQGTFRSNSKAASLHSGYYPCIHVADIPSSYAALPKLS